MASARWAKLLSPGAWWRWGRRRLVERRCTSVGGPLTLEGWPLVSNDGVLSLGQGVTILSQIHPVSLGVYPQGRLEIGNQVLINNGTIISAQSLVSLGDGCSLGYHVLLLDSDQHPVVPGGEVKCAPIVVGRGAWLGSRVIVLRGVTVGEFAVVASGAVVTKDVPAHALVAGVPAQLVRMLAPGEGAAVALSEATS